MPPHLVAQPHHKLGNLLDVAGFDYESSEQVRDEILPAGTRFVAGLDNGLGAFTLNLSVAERGLLDIKDASGRKKTIRITRLHLEEDAGKLVHSASDGRLAGAMESFVDYNRGGVPLADHRFPGRVLGAVLSGVHLPEWALVVPSPHVLPDRMLTLTGHR